MAGSNQSIDDSQLNSISLFDVFALYLECKNLILCIMDPEVCPSIHSYKVKAGNAPCRVLQFITGHKDQSLPHSRPGEIYCLQTTLMPVFGWWEETRVTGENPHAHG